MLAEERAYRSEALETNRGPWSNKNIWDYVQYYQMIYEGGCDVRGCDLTKGYGACQFLEMLSHPQDVDMNPFDVRGIGLRM